MPDLDSSLAEVSTRLGGEPGDVTVYLTANETEFRELSGGRLPHWGVGYALPDRGVILLVCGCDAHGRDDVNLG